jgi:hypothetical protein
VHEVAFGANVFIYHRKWKAGRKKPYYNSDLIGRQGVEDLIWIKGVKYIQKINLTVK